jgi:alginate O-acetyltransferase complex protein AlgI
VEGVGRILMGILKKFVVADSLAIFALNAANATDALNNGSALGLWFLLYGYAFRLYLDFSGYSDIAIGIARLYGINLPENFNMPYTKDSITAFWQSWHMTLSTWARFYVFTPLSRVMMGWNPKPTQNQIVFVAQMSTMIVIGLWHGITLNFILWGIWHGLGLFLHKLYTDRTRTQYLALNDTPQRKRIVYWGGVALTFHFVALGWVFFALPDTALSMRVIAGLFGVRI